MVKDVLDIDFDMSVEKKNNKYFLNINREFTLDGEFNSEKAAETQMLAIADSRNRL